MSENCKKTPALLLLAAAVIAIFMTGVVSFADDWEPLLEQPEAVVFEMTEEEKITECMLMGEMREGEYICEEILPDGGTVFNHHYTGYVYAEPTCCTAGYKEYTCDMCGRMIREEYPVKNHFYENGVCVFCGKYETQNIETPHALAGNDSFFEALKTDGRTWTQDAPDGDRDIQENAGPGPAEDPENKLTGEPEDNEK